MKIKLMVLLMLIFSLQLASLDLETARKLALENNPDLLAETEATKASKNDLWKNYLSIIPTANLSGGYTKYENEQMQQFTMDPYDSQYNMQLRVNQPIFNGGKVWLGIGLNKDYYEIAKGSLKSTRLNTIAEVEAKFYSVLENRSLLEIAQKDLQTSQTNMEIGEIRMDAGTLSRAEYLQLQSELANKQVTLIQRNSMYETSLLDLQNFLQLDSINELENIEIESYQRELGTLQSLSSEDIEKFVQDLMMIGKNNNPGLEIADRSIATNKKSLWIASGNFLPTLNLEYFKSWSKEYLDQSFNDSGIAQWGLNVSVPIFPLADNGLEVAKAKHNLKKAKYEYTSLENNIELSIKSTVLNLVASAKTVSSADLAMQYSASTFEQMKERFKSGIISTNELLSAEVMYNTAQNRYTTSFYNYLKTRSNLVKLLGLEDKEIIKHNLENYGGNNE